MNLKLYKEVSVEVNSFGVIINPNFHDAEIVGINIGDNDNVTINIFTCSDVKNVIELCGVKYLKCNDFRQGNVVCEILIQFGEVFESRDLNFLLDIDQESKSDYLNKVKDDVLNGRSKVFKVNPTYGCAIVGLVNDIKILEINADSI